MMRRVCLWVLLLTSACAIALPISYQGKLTNLAGIGVNDTMDIALAIYDDPSAGTLIDADTANAVIVHHGLFSAIFDLDIPAASITGALYAEIQIDDGSGFMALVPRQQINAEFRAMWADNAINAIYADTAHFAFAESVSYDNTTSGLTATDVQGAIDELAAGGTVDLQNAYDNGNTINTSGGNAVEITVPYNGGYGLRVIGNDTDPAIYARNDSTGPAIYCSGNLRMSGSSSVRVYSTSDLNFQLDRGGSPSTTNHFRVRDDGDVVIFDIAEDGFTSVAGSLGIGNVPYDATHDTILTIDGDIVKKVAASEIGGGGTVNDSDFIQNQDTVAQPAKFWVTNKGNFGVNMVATQNDIWTDDFEDGDISDWDTTKYLSGGAVWTITNPGSRTADGGCSGTFLIVDDDNAGSGATTSASAISPVIDLTPAGTNPVFLEFNQYYNNLSTDVCSLFVYDGSSWVLLDEYTADTSGLVRYDITAYANANFQVKFKYDDNSSWAWYWMIDNLRIYYITYSTPAPSIVADGPAGNIELKTTTGDVIFDGTGLRTSGGAGIVGYDNTTSGLTATDVQSAIDEIVGIAAGGKDTLWTVAEDPADTMVIMAQTKIYGELIADSIQAVGDTVYFDDNISVECAKFGGGTAPSTIIWNEDFESGIAAWTITNTSSGGSGVPDWTDTNPGGRTASGGCTGTFLIADSDNYGFGIMNTRAESPVFDCSGYPSVTLTFDGYFNGYSSSDDAGSLFVFDGTTWQLLDAWEDNDYYGPFSYDITAYANANCQIAVQYYGDYAMYWMVDNFEVSALTGAAPPAVEICAGNINADGNLDIGGNATIGDTLKALHYRDSSGDVLIHSSDGTATISEDADGSYDISVSGGGSGCVTLDQAYDCGGAGAGANITADSGPVVVDASGASNGALNVIASDAGNASLYITHIGGGNGIWNDANYWSPSGNVAIGTGYFHTDTGWFQSNTDFICKIDADDNADRTFQVQNSAGSVMFEVDEYGNVAIANDLLIATGGIHDGVGTGAAGQVLTADGTGHFHWGTNSDNDWDRTGNLLTTHNITDSVGIGVAAPQYKLHVEGETDDYEAVGYFKNTSSPGDYIDGYGVYGECANDDYYGIGVYGVGGYMGVEGEVYPTESDYYYGVYGYVGGGDGKNYGVYGESYGDGVNYGVYADAEDNGSGTSNNYGIYAYAAGGDTNWAAYLDGDVYVDAGIDLNGAGGGVPGANTYRNDWEPGNVITVSRTNADFSDLKEAIDTANNIGNIVIKIAPGAYSLSAADSIIASVVLMGSGKGITTISGSPLTIMSSVQNIGFQNDITLSGKAMNCNFNGNVEISGGTAINCNFDNAGGTDTLGLIDGGKIEQCDFNMSVIGEGNWTISDCKFNLPANFHPPASGNTEVHIDGCDVFATITLTGSETFGYFESNKFSTGDGGAGISVSDNGSAEIKANHFVDCVVGVNTGANTSVTIQSNDFIGCLSFGIYALNGNRLDIIGNNIVGNDVTTTGMDIDGVGNGVIKDNKIENCTGDGIVVQNMDFVIDNNVCIDNGGNGILINSGLYQIVHNTLVGNGDGTSTFDLNDASTTPSSAASYNVLDTYSPAGTSAWGGAFNTQSSGLIWPGGTQLGQLP